MKLSIDQKKVNVAILNQASKELDISKAKEFNFLVEIVRTMEESIKADEKELLEVKETTD